MLLRQFSVLLLIVSFLLAATPTPPIPKKPLDYGFIQVDKQTPTDVAWSKSALPITVLLDHSCEDWAPEFFIAVDIWNRTLGKEIFKFGGVMHARHFGEGGEGLIPVVAGKNGSMPVTMMKWYRNGRLASTPIFVPNDPPKLIRLRIAVHELGHALGLAHDELPKSVMYPIALHSEWEITDGDRDRLLNKYFPQKED